MAGCATQSPKSAAGAADEEEEDYMFMTIQEPAAPKEKETYTQRRIRKQREAEAKSRVPTKAEAAAAMAAARDATLSTALPSSSKGFQMMAKLGFKPGSALGKEGGADARREPVALEFKEDRGGIGLDGERKRKVREAMEGEAKRVQAEEGEYRERVAREREERRAEGLMWAAMRVAEKMDEEDEENGETNDGVEARKEIDAREGNASESGNGGVAADLAPYAEQAYGLAPSPPPPPRPRSRTPKKAARPTRCVNILWRTLARDRARQDRERRMRHGLSTSLSRNPAYIESDEEYGAAAEEVEVDDEDEELDAFEALPPEERLVRLVRHMRERWRYCFWCKWKYDDEAMEGCPGEGEDEHG